MGVVEKVRRRQLDLTYALRKIHKKHNFLENTRLKTCKMKQLFHTRSQCDSLSTKPIVNENLLRKWWVCWKEGKQEWGREREREWGASEGPLKDCHPASKHPSTASNDSYRGRGGGEWQTGTWGQTPPWLNTLWAKFSKKMERKTTDKVLGVGGFLLIHHSISNSLPQAARNKIHLKEKKEPCHMYKGNMLHM